MIAKVRRRATSASSSAAAPAAWEGTAEGVVAVGWDIPSLYAIGSRAHSCLSATIGSTRAARRAGTKQAKSDAAKSAPDTTANVAGSVASTP